MRWTNNYNLPDRVIRVVNGKYKQTQPDINRLSVTDLIDDPLPRLLYIKFWEDIVRDYSDLLTMVQGTALHTRYEMNAGDDEVVEKKFTDVVNDLIVVGKADSFFDTTILEVKQTGCYGPKYRMDKWTKQMNCYAWQRNKRGQEVTKLLVDIWYRDWKVNNRYWREYPQIPYECIELPLWDFKQTDKWVKQMVAKHKDLPNYDTAAEYTKPCSDKQRGIRWEAYKGKNKTCTKVGETYPEVASWVQKQKDVFTIIESEPVFCKLYCKSRSVCPHAGEFE